MANLLKHSQIYDLRLKMISRRTISCLGTCLIPLESSHDRLTGEIVTIEIKIRFYIKENQNLELNSLIYL